MEYTNLQWQKGRPTGRILLKQWDKLFLARIQKDVKTSLSAHTWKSPVEHRSAYWLFQETGRFGFEEKSRFKIWSSISFITHCVDQFLIKTLGRRPVGMHTRQKELSFSIASQNPATSTISHQIFGSFLWLRVRKSWLPWWLVLQLVYIHMSLHSFFIVGRAEYLLWGV